MKECCKNCEHLGEIYIPPTFNREPVHWDACFLFAPAKQVMYLDTTECLCEMFTSKESEDERTD